jgi:hypothetical protein
VLCFCVFCLHQLVQQGGVQVELCKVDPALDDLFGTLALAENLALPLFLLAIAHQNEGQVVIVRHSF